MKQVTIPQINSEGKATGEQRTYFVDGFPKDLKEKLRSRWNNEYELAKINAKFYNHKHTQGDNDIVAQVRGFFDGIIQPTERRVRNAMILTIDEDYAIKSGGESASDAIYSSSLKIMIADPVTGLDKDVVLVKKYSTKFEEVLITPNEISELFEVCLSSKEKVGVLKDEAFSILNEVTRWKRGGKSNFKDGEYIMPFDFAVKMVANYKKRGVSLTMYEAAFKSRLEWLERDLTTQIVEDTPNVNKTKNFHDKTRKHIEALKEAKEFIFEQYKGVTV